MSDKYVASGRKSNTRDMDGPFYDILNENFPQNLQGSRSSSRRRSPRPQLKGVKKDQECQVTFSIFYETKVGESICVLGSIEELGSWKEYKCHLTWTEGHIWVSKDPIITKN